MKVEKLNDIKLETMIHAYTEQRSSIYKELKMYNGIHPICIVVASKQVRVANCWAKQLHELFDVHTIALTVFDAEAIATKLQRLTIQSVLVLNLHDEHQAITIQTSKLHIRQLLQKLQLPKGLEIRNGLLIHSAHPFTTYFTIGQVQADVLHIFLQFLKRFLPLHIRLAEQHIYTQIVRYEEKPAGPPMPLNKITLHPDFLKQLGYLENEYMLIIHPKTSRYTIGVTNSDSKVSFGAVRSSVGIRKKLALVEGDSIYLHPLKKIEANNVTVQKITHLQDGSVFLSQDLYEQLQQYTASHYEIVNPLTGASFDLSRKHFKLDAALKPETVRLNYLTREFLDYEQLPSVLTPFYQQALTAHSNIPAEQLQLFDTYYRRGVLQNTVPYEDRLKMKSILKKAGLQQVDFYPLPTNKKQPKTRLYQKLWHHYLRWTIRPAKIKLKVIRPYSTDESSTIVRMTQNSMSLLGIAENDIVTLCYRGHTISAPVLMMDSAAWMRETNILPNDAVMNISIGIPAALRLKLRMKKTGVVCTVKRDLTFLRKKNRNLQFIPIVATLLAIYAVDFMPIWGKIALIALFVPLANYISLSDVREKIPKI